MKIDAEDTTKGHGYGHQLVPVQRDEAASKWKPLNTDILTENNKLEHHPTKWIPVGGKR
ncbi:MAG: hypothetical protein HC888_15420 [Candidatus Competibacteraceae bacterium]|nr:hypothetical protein [Candidatus Competibacteraceae bacterium]